VLSPKPQDTPLWRMSTWQIEFVRFWIMQLKGKLTARISNYPIT